MNDRVSKVEGYPDLQRSGAGVINIDKAAYASALLRRQSNLRLDRVEEQVKEINEKLDLLIKVLGDRNAR